MVIGVVKKGAVFGWLLVWLKKRQFSVVISVVKRGSFRWLLVW